MKKNIFELKLTECINNNFVEDTIVKGIKSNCCNAIVRYTSNSGVYICPNLYCDKCKKLLRKG